MTLKNIILLLIAAVAAFLITCYGKGRAEDTPITPNPDNDEIPPEFRADEDL